MNGGKMLYYWTTNRIRSIGATFGLLGSTLLLLITLLAFTVLLVVSLIPLYLNRSTSEALGELYCINNYSLVVSFQIPQYNTTFTDSLTSGTYRFSQGSVNDPSSFSSCLGPVNFSRTADTTVSETCLSRMLSVVYPAVPNAQVFDSYALSEACYRTLQSCSYDRLLSACLLSNCVAITSLNPSTNGSYPLTNYRLRCKANIYYKTRCVDAAVSSRLFYSSAQQNSACRQQRLNRINRCLNSSVSLSNVPCLISVSSERVTFMDATCNQSVTFRDVGVNISDSTGTIGTIALSPTQTADTQTSLVRTFTSTVFTVSDDTDGHAYRISAVNSETYLSSQAGALYCGGITNTQIGTSINTAINSQTSG